QRGQCTKLRYAAMVAACLAYLAQRQGDSVGLYAYSASLKACLPPQRRIDGIQRVFSELQRVGAEGTADHALALSFVADHLRRRGLVVLISDLQGAEDHLEQAIRRIRFAHHDCIVLQILDPDELELPFSRTVCFVDSETGQEITTAPELIAEGYRAAMRGFLERVRRICLSQQTDYLLVPSSENLGNLLAAYLHRREALT
ncbi:MAG: VWA domain-containing protein, partial [Lentisphaeria bacterium]|nr:VWA domain-containing protein [Lentisphaeria bacterium]